MNYSKYNFNPYQFTPPEEMLLDAHCRHVPFFTGCSKVLDLGAGRGLFLRCLKDAGIQGLGVENHLPSIELGTTYGLTFHKSDIFEFFNSEDGKDLLKECDGIYCCFVIEHLDPESVFELFRLIKLNCRANVRCRFITHNPEDIDALGTCLYGDLTHRRLYVPAVLGKMAESQGLREVAYRTFLGMRLGKRDTIQRAIDWVRWGKHKWRPNYQLDCWT